MPPTSPVGELVSVRQWLSVLSGAMLFRVLPELEGAVAEWSCSGLQLRVRRFDSDPRLHYFSSRCQYLL